MLSPQQTQLRPGCSSKKEASVHIKVLQGKYARQYFYGTPWKEGTAQVSRENQRGNN